MVIVWTPEANEKIDEICSYYERSSIRVAKRLFADINQAAERLKEFPLLAEVEELLAGKEVKYRSLIVRKHYKIVYFVDEANEKVVIITVFDCRQNPKKLIRLQ